MKIHHDVWWSCPLKASGFRGFPSYKNKQTPLRLVDNRSASGAIILMFVSKSQFPVSLQIYLKQLRC